MNKANIWFNESEIKTLFNSGLVKEILYEDYITVEMEINLFPVKKIEKNC